MRLSDKENKTEDIALLSNGIDEALTKMLKKPQYGGYPLLYFFLASKKHEIVHCNCPKVEDFDLNSTGQEKLVEKLDSMSCGKDCDKECICQKPKEGLSDEEKITRQEKITLKLMRLLKENCSCVTTAATNGKKFLWSAQYMREMIKLDKLQIIMMHEVLHLIGHHCRRMFPMTPLKNMVVDLFVNGMIQKELGNNIWWHKVINFETLKKMVTGELKLDPETKVCYVDIDVLTRTPEEVYDELKRFQKVPEDLIELMDIMGSGDRHIPEEMSPEDLRKELMNALAASRHLNHGRGTNGAGIEEMIEALIRPRIRAADIIKNYAMIHAAKNGSINDYKRFRRRYIGMTKPMYLPTSKGQMANILVALDSSGSVGDESLARFLGDLHSIVNNANLLVVPNDAIPYWDKAKLVRNTSEIMNMRIVGRGGTAFTQFFLECRSKVNGFDFNMILVLTDGGIDEIDPMLDPGVDVCWLVINNRNFKEPFGRTIHVND